MPEPTTIAFSNGLSEGCLISGTSNASTFTTAVSGYCNGKVIETWTATDSCGRTVANVSRTITIDDKTPPTFTAPSNIIIATNESCSYNSSVAITGDVTDENDNCSIGIQATYNDQITEGPCDGSSTINRTWSLMDLCGNKAEDRIQIITVKDTTPPQIATQASDILVSCDGQGNQTQLSDWLNSNGGAIATDNCSKTLYWTNDFNALSNDCSTSVTVTFSVKDNCGNASTTTATFSINDTIKPVLGEVPADMTVECDAVPTASAEDVTATDNCETNQTVTYAEVRTDGNCTSNYILTRTWTATDACSNSSSKSQKITVQDTNSPVLGEIPVDITVECEEVPTASAEDVSATDNCDNNPIVSYQEVKTDGNCISNYTLTRTWTATDACGNSSSKSQRITVQDTTAPLLGELPSDITVECNAVPTASEEDVSATDNCDNNPKVSYEEVRTDGNCISNYTLTRTWTATDVCGNSSSKSQTIIVQDTTAPLLGEIPEDVTVECDVIRSASAKDVSAIDNCDDNPIVSYEEVRTDGDCINKYTLTRTWTATDVCGNSSSKSQTITVEDTTTAVIISCANEQTIASDSSCKALVPDFTSTLIVSDNCTPSESLIVSQSPLAGSEVMAGITTITLTVEDACGNESTCETKLTVTNYIVANDDDVTATPINGFSGGIAIPNVLTNDLLNCQEINPSEVTIIALSDPTDGVTLNAITGEVIVAPGTPTGIYAITYQICEITNPTNCDDALITVTVSAAVIDAIDDIGGYVTTAVGGQSLENVLNNDTLNGNPATLSNINLIQVSTTNPGITLNTSTGAINVTAGTPAGNYLLTYQICDKLNSSNCDTATVSVFIASPELQVTKTANNENYSSVGDILNYTITVTNTGNVTLYQITVTDDLTGLSTTIESLAPGSTKDYTQNYTVTQEDRVRGFVTNIARANGFAPDELPISGEDSATVEAAIVLGCATITVHNAFSPNGDGINEIFVIDNLEDVLCYPNNSVEIYNRWGVLVFETKDYNSQSNYFDGISRGRATVSQSSGLPTGTYYYILNYTSIDGTGGLNNNRKDGFLYLTR
ncbi:von Willebrand factor, type A [Flavobacterium frigoris PS1]|uniref:von Willebrand factor, type A n=1 Tax=Flavobacterium frigoris (strain PS1) TaxID=1086011 RepID=H7FSY0_FLAFP|nr:von Willebrand factor, type A [Flavobacterium frigoris PS1]